MEESAAVDGGGGFEAVIKSGDDAGEVSAPAYTSECGVFAVDFWEA